MHQMISMGRATWTTRTTLERLVASSVLERTRFTVVALSLMLALASFGCDADTDEPDTGGHGCPSRSGLQFCQLCGSNCEYCPSGSICSPCGQPCGSGGGSSSSGNYACDCEGNGLYAQVKIEGASSRSAAESYATSMCRQENPGVGCDCTCYRD